MRAELIALKSFVVDQIYMVKKWLNDKDDELLIKNLDQIEFLKQELKSKDAITKMIFFLPGFSSQTLTIHCTAGEGRGSSFIPLYHFHLLANIEAFICNFGNILEFWKTTDKMLIINFKP